MEDFVYFVIMYLIVGSLGVVIYYSFAVIFAKLFPEYKIPVSITRGAVVLCLLPPLSFMCVLGFVCRIIYETKFKDIDVELYNYSISIINAYDNGFMSRDVYTAHWNNILTRYKLLKSMKK